MLLIPKRHRQTDRRTDGRTDGRLTVALPRSAFLPRSALASRGKNRCGAQWSARSVSESRKTCVADALSLSGSWASCFLFRPTVLSSLIFCFGVLALDWRSELHWPKTCSQFQFRTTLHWYHSSDDCGIADVIVSTWIYAYFSKLTYLNNSWGQDNKYKCTMDQELANAAA